MSRDSVEDPIQAKIRNNSIYYISPKYFNFSSLPDNHQNSPSRKSSFRLGSGRKMLPRPSAKSNSPCTTTDSILDDSSGCNTHRLGSTSFISRSSIRRSSCSASNNSRRLRTASFKRLQYVSNGSVVGEQSFNTFKSFNNDSKRHSKTAE
jgi:hypothetical protein